MKFEILGPSGEVLQVVETDANPVKIGKTASCELCLDNASVSRVHAVLEKSGNGYKLSDRISATGTFVNRQKVDPSKPAMVEDGAILTFGQVSVRVNFGAAESGMGGASIVSMDNESFDDEEEGSGATLAMAAPSLEELAAGMPASEIEEAAPAMEAPTPSVNAMPAAPAAPTPSVNAMPAAPAAKPAVSLEKKPAPAAKAAGFGGFGGGATFGQSNEKGGTTIIKKKKRLASFERRFLSARGTGSCVLEVAMVWRDNVLSIKQYKAENGKRVLAGTGAGCDYLLDTGTSASQLAIAQCIGGNWELVFNNAFNGFVLVGDKKIEFNQASNAEFTTPRGGSALAAGSLACAINGDIRAKFVFGEVSLLVHYVDAVPFAAPLFGNMGSSNYGGLVASLLIHFALFSVILFATDRVDALMIDRIMSTSRFAVVVEEPIEEAVEEEKPDEEEPEEEEEEPEEESDLVKDAPDTPFAANSNSDNISNNNNNSMSKSEAVGAAMQTGLLAQANAMNSMLGAAMDMQDMNLDWSNFDASAQAAMGGYGLGTTGAGGGGAGMGGFGSGGFGPGGGGGGGAIRAASHNYNANIGTKGEARPAVKMKNPEVTGSLDKRIIQKVVRQHSGELKACYEKEANKIKGLNGRVVVMWIISPQGAVTKAIVKESTLKNKNVENCVINSIKFWRFPAPKGGGMVSIEYPFVFEMSSN